ncbi:hypothetical protein GCM10007859_18900 [Brevundimonas denitrificans]|uniref:Uncharacterized protein n=1 Tax=Brevundimonas denitrificans TaxID=1443434 RepID=A0ABQ6BK85_9CAUL|nr:hypothetical protein GCM10007859_18900 [Brevundimonas denitrificans]
MAVLMHQQTPDGRDRDHPAAADPPDEGAQKQGRDHGPDRVLTLVQRRLGDARRTPVGCNRVPLGGGGFGLRIPGTGAWGSAVCHPDDVAFSDRSHKARRARSRRLRVSIDATARTGGT